MSSTTDGVSTNRQYKDRLFCRLFGDESSRKDILSLYNALNGTNYDNQNDLEITTIEDVIYLGIKNDVSFLIDNHLTLWEHQSTYNPNMLIRGFMYFGRLYESYINIHDEYIYGKSLIRLPTPKYVVFYNGETDTEPVTKLKLSDAFINRDDSREFEWTATMINLNVGKNDELLSKCKILSDYMTFVNKMRLCQKKGYSSKQAMCAIKKVIDECIAEGVLSDFLRKHQSEVLGMCLTEYNEKMHMDNIREEAREETREKDIGILIETLKEFNQSNETIAAKLMEKYGLTEAEAKMYLSISTQ